MTRLLRSVLLNIYGSDDGITINFEFPLLKVDY